MSTYTFYFDLTGCVEIEADSSDEAQELFDEIDDYSYYVNPSDTYNVTVYEDRRG